MAVWKKVRTARMSAFFMGSSLSSMVARTRVRGGIRHGDEFSVAAICEDRLELHLHVSDHEPRLSLAVVDRLHRLGEGVGAVGPLLGLVADLELGIDGSELGRKLGVHIGLPVGPERVDDRPADRLADPAGEALGEHDRYGDKACADDRGDRFDVDCHISSLSDPHGQGRRRIGTVVVTDRPTRGPERQPGGGRILPPVLRQRRRYGFASLTTVPYTDPGGRRSSSATRFSSSATRFSRGWITRSYTQERSSL